MSDVKELAQEWFEKGKRDLETARFLYENNHYLDIIALHIQQALEKYFKGFLIQFGWDQKRTHDLVLLSAEIEKYGVSLAKYLDVIEKINEYYIESRYPLPDIKEYSREEIEESLWAAEKIIVLLIHRTSPGGP